MLKGNTGVRPCEVRFDVDGKMLTKNLVKFRACASRFGGLGQDNLERSPAWQQPWTEEAVLHYLNMQGYHVPLKMEDSLLEEDANALAQQDAAVKYGGILSKEALARNPPYIPGLFHCLHAAPRAMCGARCRVADRLSRGADDGGGLTVVALE